MWVREETCALCGSELDFMKEYGYTEPIKRIYICSNCNCEYTLCQDAGWGYDDSNVDWDRV